MADKYQEIYALLREQLNNVPDLPDVMWENYYYEPDPQTLYVEAWFFPSPSQTTELGENADTFETGLFAINVVGVRFAGSGACYEWVDAIQPYFKRGTTLTSSDNSLTVRVKKYYPSSGFMNSSGRYVVPINVLWHCFMPI